MSCHPTAGAASAIAEVVLYNVFETLTKIGPDGRVSPLLAESWEVSPDLKTFTFKLRKGVKFQNGEPFNAQAVVFSFKRAGAEKSTNKDKRTFASMERVAAIDDHTVVIINKELNPDFLFLMGQATAILVAPVASSSWSASTVLPSWAERNCCDSCAEKRRSRRSNSAAAWRPAFTMSTTSSH